MIKLSKIYFDGQSYARYLVENNEMFSKDKIDLANQLNFTPVDSISFEKYHSQKYCDITIGSHHFEAVSKDYLYTDIKEKPRVVLYPSHNPSPDPGGLY